MTLHEKKIPFDVLVTSENEFRPKFEAACEWLDSLGLAHHATRFGAYKRFFAEFQRNDSREQTFEEYRASISRFLTAYAESSDLVRIATELSSINASAYLDRLKKVVKGSAFKAVAEKDRSRDFAFELATASRFLHAGYEVDLTTLADIVAIIEGRRVFIECKRIRSPEKLEANIRSAREQLKTRISHQVSSKTTGLVALNVSTAIALERPEVHGGSEHEIQATHSWLMNKFVQSNQGKIISLQTRFIAGYLVEATLGGIAVGPTQYSLVNVRGMKICIGPATSARDEALLDGIAVRAHSQLA